MKQQFLIAIAGTIRLTAYDKNRPLIPTAALITLYKTDGNAELQAQSSASIDATTGEMTYALTATHTATKGLNYKAVWKYTYGGNDYYETQLFDVVRSILSIPITDDDLFNELPSLKKSNYQSTGTATAGSTSTLVDTGKRKEIDDYWKGGVVEIMAGTGASQTRDISSFVQSSGTVNVTPNWQTTPDTTSVYRIVKSYSAAIAQSFEKIEQLLYNKGKRDSLILESSQIRIVLIYLTIKTISQDLREEMNDRWDLIAKDYETLFKNSYDGLTLDYDEDESGGVAGIEVQQHISSIRIERS